MSSVITRRLDLVLHLIDATTGHAVNEAMTQFETDREDMKFISRDYGTYILINSGRDNFLMQIAVKGYEKVPVEIKYEELNEVMPLKEVFLIPSERTSSSEDVLFMKGNLPGLQSVSLIETNKVLATTNSYEPKKRLLQLFERGYRLSTEGSSYGIINREARTFEVFDIEELPNESQVKLRKPLQEEFQRNSQIGRIVNGYVYPNGDYLIGVRNDNAKKPTIVRFVTDEVKFMEVDFVEINKPQVVEETEELPKSSFE